MKNLIIFSILTSTILNVILVWLFWNTNSDNNPMIIQNIQIDTAFIKQELQRLTFNNVAKTQNTTVVYVPQKVIERYEVNRQPINHYYYDSITIIQNGDKVVNAMLTKDTIANADGTFRISALSPGPVYNLGLDYELNAMQITKTVTTLPNHQFFVGGSVGGNSERFKFGTEVQYQLNGRHGFKYEYDWINGGHSVGYLRRIELK
jgi:hypothetical protein